MNYEDHEVQPGVTEPVRYEDPAHLEQLRRDDRIRRRRSIQSTIIETLLIVGAAFAIAMLVQTFAFRITGILQNSMQPTIEPGDRIIVNCLTYHFRDPRPGDVVVVHDPEDDTKDIVKRVVAVEGDTIEVIHGMVYVDGILIDEPYVVNEDVIRDYGKLTVPEDSIFVLGDNRPMSKDSRSFGPVAEDQIIGKVMCVMWPVGHWKTL